MFERLREDVRTALETDPAAKTRREVITCYPGLQAVWLHRIAHALWSWGFHWLARLVSHLSRGLTNIEIHPAAEIGRRCFIDHGSGVVIGETAAIGDDVHMHHGCTLGGNSPYPEKRHPTLEDGVTLGANATLIGDITIGEDATVGAGAVVVEDVPPETTVTGVPAEPVERTGSTPANGVDRPDVRVESIGEDDIDGTAHGVLLDTDTPDPDRLLAEVDDALSELDQRKDELEALREDVERLRED
ncbi:Serine acetyltransferase [Natranaeroarchaeum sulfidigenes]|uniref:serine O-acetyltransferase n=1 Tax=Natranaeroarchaeum sulfidigenes TaxID=2784880 RepID=A0A897MN11_9EURY|nr:Serine acetyltransferase [Natranaeroarchaeum sulfidigenes]